MSDLAFRCAMDALREAQASHVRAMRIMTGAQLGIAREAAEEILTPVDVTEAAQELLRDELYLLNEVTT
jgi:hypothetical protein